MELQNEYVDLILNLIYKSLKLGKDGVSEAVSVMLDLGITNDILKEHLIQLSLDQKLTQSFDSLETQVKSAFTRDYNKRTASNTTGVTKKGKTKKEAAGTDDATEHTSSDSEVEDEEEEEMDAMLDEDEQMELKKGKMLQKEDEKRGRVEKASRFEMLQIKDKAAAKKAKSQAKAADGGIEVEEKKGKAKTKQPAKKK